MTRHSNKQKNKNKKTKHPTPAHKKEKSQYFEMEPETTQKIKLINKDIKNTYYNCIPHVYKTIGWIE